MNPNDNDHGDPWARAIGTPASDRSNTQAEKGARFEDHSAVQSNCGWESNLLGTTTSDADGTIYCHGLPTMNPTRDYVSGAGSGPNGASSTATKETELDFARNRAPPYFGMLLDEEDVNAPSELPHPTEAGARHLPSPVSDHQSGVSFVMDSPPTLHNSQTWSDLDESSEYAPISPPPSRDGVSLATIAPQPGLMHSEPDSFDDEAEIKIDDAPTVSPDNRQTLPESHCPFSRTTTWSKLFDSEDRQVPIVVEANFTRKYPESTKTIQHWVFYRRNYFGVAVQYLLEPPSDSISGELYLYTSEGAPRVPVKAIELRMKAVKMGEYGEETELVLHDSKRAEIVPRPSLAQKMKPNRSGYPNLYYKSTGDSDGNTHLHPNHTFLRCQFRKATQKNGVRSKMQEYFRIVIEAYAEVLVNHSGKSCRESHKIGSTTSGRIVTRGRCPQSFEIYDPANPNHSRRKPPKGQDGRRNYKGSRPAGIVKKHGSSKNWGHANEAPKKGPSQRSHRTSFSTKASSSRASPAWKPKSRPSSDATLLSGIASPPMTPEDKILESVLLPSVGVLGNPSIQIGPRTLLQQEQLGSRNEFCSSVANQVAEVQKRHSHRVAAQLAPHGFSFDLPDDASPTQSSDPTLVGYGDVSAPWELIDPGW